MVANSYQWFRFTILNSGHNRAMELVVIAVIVMVVAAFAIAAGLLDGPRRARRTVVVREPDVVVERERPQTVVTERTVTTERDPLN